MKLLSIASARSVWLFPFQDLNPRGKALMPMLMPLVERYRFIKFPQKPEELVKVDHLEFNEGRYKTNEGNEILVSLKVYNDGLVVDSRSSTNDCEAFLHDLLTWAAKNYGFLPYDKVIRRKLYVSEVYVCMKNPLGHINPAIKTFTDKLANYDIGYGPFPFEISGISFGNDPEKIQGKAMTFRLERAEGAPFTENRFFSVAPFPTETHLALLEQLEKVLTP